MVTVLTGLRPHLSTTVFGSSMRKMLSQLVLIDRGVEEMKAAVYLLLKTDTDAAPPFDLILRDS